MLPAPSGARAVVVGGTAWHVVAADVDPSWVAAQVAADPIAAPLSARFLTALADRVTFFATSPADADRLRRSLREFAPTLPSSSRLALAFAR